MAKDTRKLLIESSEFVSKVKLSKGLKESVKLSAGKAGTLIVKNVPCTILNRRNQNGRIYSTALLEAAIQEAQEAIASRQLLCAGNEHPEGSFVPPTEASHVVINAYIKKNVSVVVEGKRGKHDVLFMDLMILNTENGKNARALFEAECSIGTSIRGLGDLVGDEVQNYTLLGVDLVGQPSSSTYTRMPVSESVKVELADEKALTEGFTLSTSSTNVVRDLETAADVQNRINDVNYGTIIKTSTKVDEELNPKTGATTSITTLETETQDDVASLDQALAMAKRAMLNGVSHIDSITIDNIEEEEDAKESIEQINDQPDTIEMGKNDPNVNVDDVTALNDAKVSAVGALDQDFTNSNKIEYEPESKLNEEGKLEVQDLKGTRILNPTQDDLWNVANELRNAIADKENMEWQRSYNSLKTNEAPQYIIDYADGKEVEKESIKEAKESNPNEGRRFVLKCPAGFVAMDGNALVFKENPKEAIHFIVGKEESGLVHLSGVEKILDTMGVYDVEKYYRKDKKNTQEQPANKEECVATQNKDDIKEDAGEQFTATINIDGDETEKITNTIPVSSTDLSSATSEIANLYDMKVQTLKPGQSLSITVDDKINNAKYKYNADGRALEPIEVAQTESVGDISQNDKTLTMDVTDNLTIEKEFDTQAAASVAKSGLEQGKFDGDVMLSEEADDDHSILIHVEKQGTRGEDATYNAYFFNKADNLDMLNRLKADIDSIIPDWGSEWGTSEDNAKKYIQLYNVTEGQLNKVLEGLQKLRHFEFGWDDGVGKIKAPMGEKLYSEPTPGPSDDFVEKPLTDAAKNPMLKQQKIDMYNNPDPYKQDDGTYWEPGLELVKKEIDKYSNLSPEAKAAIAKLNEDGSNNITITLSDIDWDVDSIADLLLDGNKDLTWIEKINALPSKLNVTITADELNSAEDIEALKEILLKSANETSNVVINGATIEGIA